VTAKQITVGPRPEHEHEPHASPYPGTRSFETADGQLFFGRDGESNQITNRILSNRCTLLYAQSGAGKTSLLNARVIPRLERAGYTPVRIRFDDNPVEAVRARCIATLLVPPTLESRALGRATLALFGPGADPTLGELVEAYLTLPVSDPRSRELVRRPAFDAPRFVPGLPEYDEAVPVLCRLLHGRIDHEALTRALRITTGHPWTEVSVLEEPCSALLEVLESEGARQHFGRVLGRVNLPVPGLLGFCENLQEIWADFEGELRLVLLFDQFEELYTRFTGEEGRPGAPDRALREDFLANWRELVGTDDRGSAATPRPTIHYVISMREEYIARLGGVRHFLPEIYENGYYLELLETRAAEAAIAKPAAEFGLEYDEGALAEIVTTLERGGYVTPAALQIVCSRLWHGLARNAREEARVTTAEIAEAGRGGGVQGILDGFVADFLEALPSDRHRRETLDVLTPLITTGGTRNIMARDELVQAPLRSASLRSEVIDRMVGASILRVERRNETEFTEIMHEFLTQAILRAIEHDREHLRIASTIHTLRRFQDADYALERTRVLSAREFEDVEAVEGELAWTPWAEELMLRSLVVLGDRIGDHRARVRRWLERLGARAVGDLGTVVSELPQRRQRAGSKLSIEELILLDAQRDSVACAQADLIYIWQSAMEAGDAAPREMVSHWTRKALIHA
jgi:hypothetical protein